MTVIPSTSATAARAPSRRTLLGRLWRRLLGQWRPPDPGYSFGQIAALGPFDESALRVLRASFLAAETWEHHEVHTSHLVFALIKDDTVKSICARAGMDVLAVLPFAQMTLVKLRRPPLGDGPPLASANLWRTMVKVAMHFQAAGADTISAAEILIMVVRNDDDLAGAFAAASVDFSTAAMLKAIDPALAAATSATPESTLVALRMHNDHFTTQEWVVKVLTEALGMPEKMAAAEMLTIHREGSAVVLKGKREDVMALAESIRAASAEAGFPLRLSLEPAEPEEPGEPA